MGPSPSARLGLRLRGALVTLGARMLTRLMGTADGRAVGAMAARELSLVLRSGEWHRFLFTWVLFCSAVIAVPVLYRSDLGSWNHPSGELWFVFCGYTMQAGAALFMAQWTVRRLRRDLYTSRLDELLLTRCTAADIAMGEALASAIASLWLVAAGFPVFLFLAGLAGQEFPTAARLALTVAPAGALGVWFGMGWGLAFTLRRPGAALAPLTEWWVKAPLAPVYVVWGALLFVPIAWAVLVLVPGGMEVLLRGLAVLQWTTRQAVQHWNPLLAVGAAAGLWGSTWLTDWLVLVALLLFMMRKSMDGVQAALATLPERDTHPVDVDYWIHHDGHYFTQYGEGKRRQPRYYDGGNPVAAFDVALGHRVYLHPFLWAVAVMAYLFLLGWSLLVPRLGLVTGILAVLTPATGALLLMSGGVAVSFGWERDQHRWPSLAVLPISNTRLALGKVKGVVRPTLWVGLAASLTALLLGWRGTIQWEASLWMAIHVLVFPVALAFVSATLALTTPTVGEALYRWAVLGAIPTLATVLPPPVGGPGGLALPCTPPLLVLLLVLEGPGPALVRAAWIALGLELLGITASILILALFLRRLTVGERDA